MKVIDLIDKDKLKCEFCKEKPDYLYFRDHDLEILSIICQSCRDIFEKTFIAKQAEIISAGLMAI